MFFFTSGTSSQRAAQPQPPKKTKELWRVATLNVQHQSQTHDLIACCIEHRLDILVISETQFRSKDNPNWSICGYHRGNDAPARIRHRLHRTNGTQEEPTGTRLIPARPQSPLPLPTLWYSGNPPEQNTGVCSRRLRATLRLAPRGKSDLLG